MKQKLDEILAVTNQLLEELEQVSEDDANRATIIDQVNILIEQREALIQQLHRPYTPEEIALGEQIVKINENIKRKMDVLYEAVKTDMKQVQKKKEQNYSYLKPYGGIRTTDGMYMDNKL